jgi:hypothetical protein
MSNAAKPYPPDQQCVLPLHFRSPIRLCKAFIYDLH